jgi:hypothetical protein
MSIDNTTLTDSDVIKAQATIKLYRIMELLRKSIPSSPMHGATELGDVRGWSVEIYRNKDFYSIAAQNKKNAKDRVDSDLILTVRRGDVYLDMPSLNASQKLNDSAKADIFLLVRRLWEPSARSGF